MATLGSSSPEVSASRRRRRFAPPLRIGLTGGIASGKSTVAALFAQLGVPVIDTDRIARQVVEAGTPILGAIVTRFGPTVLQPDGQLDRRRLRSLVFADAGARADLEALTHPAIHAETERQCREAGGRYQLIAVPLLAEKGLKDRYDRVLVVDCAPEIQRLRLMYRDGSSEREALAVLAAQASREARLALADEVIRNDGDLRQLAAQVADLHSRYLQFAADPRIGG
jgi:dephospho-CoA kinase